MSFVNLMTGGSAKNPWFGFDHAASHQEIAYWMAADSQYAVEPFWFDPRSAAAGSPASIWQIKHQQTHNDMSAFLPPPSGSMSFGLSMVDSDLNLQEPLQWSLFANLTWHMAAYQELGPLVS